MSNRSTSGVEPFFVAPGFDAGQRRLLLVSFHFAPDTAVGALRWQRFAVHAARRAWGMDVVTCAPGEMRSQDPQLLAELPPGTRLYGVPTSAYWLDDALLRAVRLTRRVRQQLFPASPARGRNGGGEGQPNSMDRNAARWFPPTRQLLRRSYHAWANHVWERGWAQRAASAGKSIIAKAGVARSHTVIVSCGPPHMAHAAGRELARSSGLPHVVDMRDPWSLVERLPEWLASPLWFMLAAREESRVIPDTRLVVANTEQAAAALRERYPSIGNRIVTVFNGFDDDPIPQTDRPRRFIIAYAGTVYLDRDPRTFFRACGLLAAERRLTAAEFGIEFIGSTTQLDGVPLSRIAEEEGIARFLNIQAHMPRSELYKQLAGAAMLLILPQDSRMAIPAKAFEYLRFDAWVLALAEKSSATGQLLGRVGADVVPPGDLEGITRLLATRFDQYTAGQFPQRLSQNDRYSRREQARILFDALEAVTASSSGGRVEQVGRGPDWPDRATVG